MIIYFVAFFVVWVLWKLHFLYNKNPFIDYSENSVPLLRNSINMTRINAENAMPFLRKTAAVLKKSYRHKFFHLNVFNIIRAKDAEKILGSSKHNEKSFIYDFIHPFVKTGLLTSKGDKWHIRRRMLTPAFHFDILKEFLEVFREESDKLVLELGKKAGQATNIIPISSQFTLNTICETAMGVKLENLGNDGVIYRNNIYKIGNLFLYRLIRPWLYWNIFHLLFGEKRKIDNILKPIHSFTKSIIMERKANFKSEEQLAIEKSENDENVYFRSKKRRYAMMDTLLKAQRDGLIDDEGIIEETDTFTFEGHDTTSSAVTFTLLLLAHHPEAQENIFEEIQELKRNDNDRELTIDNLNKMDYFDRVIKESLRIYPPVHFISRVLTEDFENDDVTHKKGTTCHIHIFDVHRDPEVFPDPEKFDPDRFLPENCVDRNNFAFIAFSAGMRNCIGQRFAMLELKLMLSKIVENFRIDPITTREEVVFIADLVLRSKHAIQLKFERRI